MMVKALPAVSPEAEETAEADRQIEIQVQDTIQSAGKGAGNAAEQFAKDPVLPLGKAGAASMHKPGLPGVRNRE